MGKREESAQWLSISDMMTWLMLVFLLIAVAFMYQVQLKQKELEMKQEEKKKILVEYNESNISLYNKLKTSFNEKEKKWWMNIGSDLTIKFNKEDISFEPDQYILREKFRSILDDFIPSYLKIINDEKYKNQIKEIKIEWHAGSCLDYEYAECLILSQKRANSVLLHLLNSESFKKLDNKDKEKLKFWFTANWMSNWKNVDSDWKFVYETNNEIDTEKSRRVAFRIITNSEDLIKRIIEKEEIKK